MTARVIALLGSVIERLRAALAECEFRALLRRVPAHERAEVLAELRRVAQGGGR